MSENQTKEETNVLTAAEEPVVDNWPENVDLIIELPGNRSIVLPEVSSGETLHAIRQALADFQETAFLTSFKWELLALEEVDGTKIEKSQDFVNDFSELNNFLQPNVKKCHLKITEEPYDAKKVRSHVKRLKDTTTRAYLVSAAAKDAKESATEEKGDDDEQAAAASGEEKEKSKKAAETKAEPLPKFEKLHDPLQISDFYSKAFITSNKSSPTETNKAEPLNSVVKSVFVSGWNPPPSNRRIQGDLMYLEVVLASEGTVYITATARGFYVNRSNRNNFDPRPANTSHYNHNLFNTLLSYSSNLKTAWSAFVAYSNAKTFQNTRGPLEALYNQLQSFDGDVATLPPNTWFVGSDKNASNYDLFRAQEYVNDLHGVEELGAPREWNDEIQSIRALPANELNEKVVKARLEYRIISDFTENCKKVAVAISDGLIAPLTYADPSQNNIYVYNGIFISRAEDIKDAFKLCEGEEAARKTTARDLLNQKLVKALEIDGLGTVLCTIVDYKGTRYVAQSIIPGIFNQGDNCAQLSYGLLESDKNMTVKNSSLKVYQEIAAKLNLAERNLPVQPIQLKKTEEEIAAAAALAEKTEEENAHSDPLNKLLQAADSSQAAPIKVDEVDNVPIDEATQSIKHIGSVESKLIKGSDGRLYAIEFMRLTPRDANYVEGEKGTKKLSDEGLQKGDTSLYPTYLLRQELLSLFIHRKVNVARQALLVEAANKEKELSGTTENSASTESKEKEETKKEATTSTTPEVTTVEGDEEDIQIVKEESKKDETPVIDEALQNSLATEYAEKFRQITPKSLGLEVNVNCFYDFISEVNAEQLQKDEDLVREISSFLFDNVIPMVTKQIREGEFFPRDLSSMVNYLHRMGVNMRYLGYLAKLASDQEKEDSDLFLTGKQRIHSMPFYWLEFLIIEMLSRSVKHLLNNKLRNNTLLASAPATTIASLLNHVLSILADPSVRATAEKEGGEKKSEETTATAIIPAHVDEKKSTNKKKKKKGGSSSSTNHHQKGDGLTGIHDSTINLDHLLTSDDYLNGFTSREECLQELSKMLAGRYLYEFSLLTELLTPTPTEPTDADAQQTATNNFLRTRLSPTMLIHRICQQCGIVLAVKNYSFRTSLTPITKDDIIGLVPKTKTSEPDSYINEFNEYLNTSSEFLQQGNDIAAFEYAQQAVNVINQITGPTHLHAFQATDQLSAVLINSTTDLKLAISMASRSLLLSAQVYGIASQETILHLIQLGVLYAEININDLALEYYQSAKYYLQLIAGDHHPELANIYMRMAALYEKLQDIDTSLKCLFRARVYTGDLFKSCMLTISIASLYYHHGYVHEAVNTQKNGYKILKELVKDNDERLMEVKKNLEMYIRASSTTSQTHRYPLEQVVSSSSQGDFLEAMTNAGSSSPEGEREEAGKKKKKNNNKKSKGKK
eukprot:CAMPEP_0173137880 /NCGR_PEP_ID=MMETSP1105-20130129/3356_1 /TAXON_ID=2985 /ORGANISM="Ochromonas sp., Strain BG-1" /LENGTH=1420 /DNA_ID=CAMNT_0014050365 /DNA_START=191 /DNA_END=4453 /DNA_ORIENTATION=-